MGKLTFCGLISKAQTDKARSTEEHKIVQVSVPGPSLPAAKVVLPVHVWATAARQARGEAWSALMDCVCGLSLHV